MTNATLTTTATIEYDESDFEMQPYVVMVNGREFLRFNTQAKAEGAIAWHTKNATLPTWEEFNHSEELEYSHISQANGDEVLNETYSYSVDTNFVCFLEVDMYAGTWFNGDGTHYKDWRDAGQAFYTKSKEFQTMGNPIVLYSGFDYAVIGANSLPELHWRIANQPIRPSNAISYDIKFSHNGRIDDIYEVRYYSDNSGLFALKDNAKLSKLFTDK